MSEDNSILALHGDGFSWIRCEGKGTFVNSPRLKDWGEREIENGVSSLVIDLQECKGMDSTFMGTMAGLAMKLAKVPGGRLQVVEPGERNRKSLEGLGLGVLMDIDPETPAWSGNVSDIRSGLEPCRNLKGKVEQATHVLEAHQKLVEADGENLSKFGTVLDFLEAEVKAKESAANRQDAPEIPAE